jgi:hypothetical protein
MSYFPCFASSTECHAVHRGNQRGTFFLYCAYGVPKRRSRPFSSINGIYKEFPMTKTANQTINGIERSSTASPRRSRKTPRIIGFRTKRYGPYATNRVGGSQGAGVPSPRRAKASTDHSADANPETTAATPSQKVRRDGVENACTQRLARKAKIIAAGIRTATGIGRAMIAMSHLRFISTC